MAMMRVKRALCAIALAFGFASGAAAAEYTASGRFDYNTIGDGAEIAPGRTFFAGAFEGTYVPGPADAGPLQFATMICPGYYDIGLAAAGYCILLDETGDRIFLTWDCSRPTEPITGALAACEGDSRWVGGTGKFAGIAGGGVLRNYITAFNPDGTARGYMVRDEAYILPDPGAGMPGAPPLTVPGGL